METSVSSSVEHSELGTNLSKEKEKKSVEELWTKDTEKVRSILDYGMQQVFDALPGKEKMFVFGEKVQVCCIDGRLHTNEENCVYIREGGSGILRTDKLIDIATRYMQLADQLNASIIEITRHENCGAEKLSGLSEEHIRQYHQDLKTTIESMVQDSRAKVCIGTIDSATSAGRDLAGLHAERAVYFTKGVFPFNPENCSDALPKGFVFNSEVSDDAGYRVANVQVSLGIALGDHGFGSFFTSESPFLLIALSHDEQALVEAKRELEQAKQNFIEAQLKQSFNEQRMQELQKSIVITGCTIEFMQN